MKGGKLHIIDRALFTIGLIVLGSLVVFGTRANIAVDSVDYYANLQSLTPAEEQPIKRNLHFAKQRSPGYSIVALIPYAALSVAVEPLVVTQKIVPHAEPPMASPKPSDMGKGSGPEPMLIPPMPLLLRQVPFKDFFNPMDGSWFQWKLALAMAITSFAFLFMGIAAIARCLRFSYPRTPGYSLAVLVVFCSPIFLSNILTCPLYATLTAFGTSALFALFFVKGYTTRRRRDELLAGAFLGLLVLTRLETGVLAVALALVLAVQRKWRLLANLVIGSAWAVVAWVIYNLIRFGTPVYLGILQGDINLLRVEPSYIFDCLFHPSSGIAFWSPLIALGLLSLLLSQARPLRALGLSALALLVLYLVRVPVMYYHVGGSSLDLGGIPLTPPPTTEDMLRLIRSDMNRYLITLAPFAALGLRDLPSRLYPLITAVSRRLRYLPFASISLRSFLSSPR